MVDGSDAFWLMSIRSSAGARPCHAHVIKRRPRFQCDDPDGTQFGALDIRSTRTQVPAVAHSTICRSASAGPTTYIRDVAKVEDSHKFQTNIVRVQGTEVYIPIYVSGRKHDRRRRRHQAN